MRCSRCERNNAEYTVEYNTKLGTVKEYLCENCYKRSLSAREKQEFVGETVAVCPFCGNGMEDYLHTGLVGCAECYKFFARELAPYVVRLQGNGEHRGKEPSPDPKYEAAQSLRELLDQKRQAEQAGNIARSLRLGRRADELKLLLFGDDEEE